MAKKWQFGQSGRSEVSENGPNEFLMPKNLGIDPKIKSPACIEPKLDIWHIWPSWLAEMAKKWQFDPQNGWDKTSQGGIQGQ